MEEQNNLTDGTRESDRIGSLDLIRGIATLGILAMNSLSFGLVPAAYFNVSADGVSQPFDWLIGVAILLFVDQKMMALFSLLFGVGVVIFADRAAVKGRRVVWLSLWRFGLLFLIGLAHSIFWDGDVLLLYAMCAPVVLLLRKLPPTLLLVLGAALALAGSFTAPLVQNQIGSDVSQLGELWFANGVSASLLAVSWFFADAAGRALGLMLIGVALYRLGVVQGDRSPSFYRQLARWGLAFGVIVTSAGLVVRVASDWSPEYAISGHLPTGLATIPFALGYLAVIVLWSQRPISEPSSPFEFVGRVRLSNVGRMALTNYLSQTALGLIILGWALADVSLTRTMVAAWMVGVWALQLWWSTWWLSRFIYGPFEWLWRCATYRSWQPLRRRQPAAVG